jgi:hypothetical protein
LRQPTWMQNRNQIEQTSLHPLTAKLAGTTVYNDGSLP